MTPDANDPLAAAADVTPWFNGRQPPAREGVYQRRDALRYACWDGVRWRGGAASPAEAARRSGASPHQNVAWRGLTEPAGAPCPTCRGHTVVDLGWDPDTGGDWLAECPDC